MAGRPFDMPALRAAVGGDDACASQLLSIWADGAPVLLDALDPTATPSAWLAALDELRCCASALRAEEVVRLCRAAACVAELPGARPCVLRELSAAVDASVGAARAADRTPRPAVRSFLRRRGCQVHPGGRA